MNADRLLEHFERISDSADAVPRLRRFVLDLAVRGKLVPQDRLYAEAATVSIPKSASAKRHRVRSQDILPQTTKDAFDFRLPDGWNAARLAEVAECLDHQREPVNSEERKARTEGKAPERLYPYYGATQQQGWIDGYLFDEPLVLLGEDGVPFLDPLKSKAYVVQGKTWVNNHAHVFRPIHIDHLFLCHWLNVFDYAGRVAGATRAKLNKSKAIDIPVPLPPLAEQHRIVAKVDELMALCDRLEAAQAERETRSDRLVSASLARVTEPASQDPASARTSARFHLDHFARLTTRPEHVKQLRQTILNLAVRGRLVQTPVDYNQTRLGEVATVQNGYAFKSQWFLKVGTRLLRNTNVSHGTLCWNECVCLSQKQTEEFDRFQLSSGDIVLSLDRPFISSGTKVAVVRDSDIPCLLLQRVGRFIINREAIAAEYLFLWVTSTHFKDQVAPGRSLGVPHIAAKDVEAAVIDLPPLGEQRRIVAKVAGMMALCDQLEASLASDASNRARLLEVLLHEALEPTA